MAATSTNIKFGPMLSEYGSLDLVALDASYPTGGYVVPTSIPISTIHAMSPAGSNTAGQGYVMQYNKQTGKIQMFWTGGATAAVLQEVAAGTSFSSATLTVLSMGF